MTATDHWTAAGAGAGRCLAHPRALAYIERSPMGNTQHEVIEMKTISTEIDRRAEEAARNRSRLAHYYATRRRRECGCPVRVHPLHRHLVKRGEA